jgi:magnesium transporter
MTTDTSEFPKDFHKDDELFCLCRTHEIGLLNQVYHFDESTVRDCADLDESVRYSNYGGYDFISLVHIEMADTNLILREINFYFSKNYVFLIVPEHDSPRLSEMEKKLLDFAGAAANRESKLTIICYMIFHSLLSDFFDTLELLEDRMQDLSEEIEVFVKKNQFSAINDLRNMAYTAKKQLRALSYIGDEIILDDNNLIESGQMQYFRNIKTRFKMLYDFSESLYSLSGEMLNTFDSRMTIKTNDTINKLTILTLFFGPLTVITGIYGMNFHAMPELGWTFGYPAALLLMIVVSLILYLILKKKKWL